MNAVESFYDRSYIIVKVNGSMNEWLIMSLRLFNVFIDGVLHEMRVRSGNDIALQNHGGTK